MAVPNKKHKDSVFTLLFSEPDKLIPLYNAISGNTYPFDTPIEITTLSDVLYLGQQNDLSFMIDNKIVILIEHQSTINENMPIRLLMYMARVYESIFSDKKKLYAEKLVKIPRPEFIVLYNGKEAFPSEMTLNLSDAYHDVETPSAGGKLDLEVKIININKGYNTNILQNNIDLNGYTTFVDEIRKNQKNKMLFDTAYEKAIKDCINRNILAEFLKKHGSEVINMLYAEFDRDAWMEVREEEMRQDIEQKVREKGLQEGRHEGIFSVARNLILENIPFDIIKNATGLSIKEIESLQMAR